MPRWVSSSLTDEEKKQLAQGTQQPAPLHPRSEDSALVPQASGQLEADPQTAAPKKRWVSANLDLGDFRGSKLQQFLPLISGQKNALDLGVHIDGGRIYRSLQLFADKTPEQAGRAQKVVDMAAGQVPFDVVISNQQEWEKWAEEGKTINELLEKDADGRYKHPITAGWLLDPKKMAIAKDDLKAVTALERIVRHRSEGWFKKSGRTIARTVVDAVSGIAQLPGAFMALLEFASRSVPSTHLSLMRRGGVSPMPRHIIAGGPMGPGYDDLRRWQGRVPADDMAVAARALLNNRLSQSLTEIAEEITPPEVNESAKDQIMAGNYGDAAYNLSLQAMGMIPYMVGLGLVGKVSKKGALAGLGYLAAAPELQEGLDEGKRLDKALLGAGLVGTVEGLFEIPTLSILSGFGKPLVKEIGKSGAKQAFKEAVLRIMGATATEGASEGATSIAQDFADWATGDPKALEGATDRAINAGLVGAFTGGAIGTMSSIAALPEQRARNKQHRQMLAELEAEAEQSKLRERAPEQFEEVVDTVVRGYGLESTFTVSLDTLKTFYQKDPDQLDKFIEKLGLQDQIEDAGKFGTELKVALGKWVTHAPELNLPPEFADHLRFEEGGLTTEEVKAEAERYTETLAELRAEVSEAAQAQALPARATALREQLMRPQKKGGLGLKAADADANIAVLMAGARVLSQHQGESAEQWFDRVNPVLKIGAAAPEAGVRGAVQFDDTQTTIHLFETADRSTFMHETAHIFTRQMNTMVEAGVGDAQLQKDLDTLKKFAGQLDTAGHEKIARAFETYLFEGKAPTFRLRDAFRRFRRWLTGIYTAIGGGPHVAINDEVRGVFDRMLAAEADIHMAQVYYGFHGTRKALMDYVKPTKREKAALDKKREKATETAIDQQIRKYVGAFVKAQGGRAQLRAQAQKEIESLPVHVALRDAVDSGGLDAADIRAEYGQETVKQLRSKNRRLAVKNGQTTLAQLAIKHNFESPDALLDALIAAPTIRPAVTARTNQLVAQAEADIRADLERHERIAGEEAVHNDDSLAYLVAEANLASKKLISEGRKKLKRLEKAAVKDAAEKKIGEMPVREVISYRPSGKPQKKADAAARKGDWAKVRKHQEEQVNQKALMEAANRARKEIEKIEARHKATKVRGRLKSVENSYANAIIQILVGHGLTQSKTLKMPKGDPLGELLKQDTNLARLIPHDLSNPKQGGWKNMTMDELRELDASVETLRADGSNELKSLEKGQYKTVQDVADTSRAAMEGIKDKKVHGEYGWWGSFVRTARGWVSKGVMMQYAFDMLDNFQFKKTGTPGPMLTLFHRLRYAEGQYNGLIAQLMKESKPHWDTLAAAIKRLHAAGGKKGFDIEGVPIVGNMQKLGRRWTGERVVAFVLNMGNAGNLAALENSYGYTRAQMDKITSLLTRSELEAIQAIWDVTNSLYPALNKVHYNLYNRYVEKVEPQPLEAVTRDGEAITLKGGYYPLVFDRLLSPRAGRHAEEDILKNETAAIFRTTKPEDGMTYIRKKKHALPPDLSVGVWSKHIHDTARYITHAEVLRDLDRVTRDQQWAEMVKDKTGRRVSRKDPKQLYENIREWVQYQARPQRRFSDINAAIDKQRRMATIAILGLNTPVSFKQRLSMFNAMEAIGMKAVVQAFLDVNLRTSAYGSTHTETWKDILRLSAYMKARDGNIDREIADATSQLKPMFKQAKIPGTNKVITWKDVQDAAFVLIRANDRAAVSVVWKAAFNKRMSELADDTSVADGKKMETAVAFADSIVQNTQPSSLPLDLNALQRSEGAMRLFTSFMTWTFKFGNLMLSSVQQYRQGALTFPQLVRAVAYHLVGPAFVALLIDSLWRDAEWPEWEDYPIALIGTLLSAIPLGRDIVYSVTYGKPVGLSPVFEGFQRGKEAYKSGADFILDDGDLAEALWDGGRVTEFALGVPVSNVVRDAQRAWNIIEKIEEN